MSYTGGNNGCDELYYTVGRVIAYIASTLALGFIGLLLFIYYWKKGQFDHIEEAKYQLFREDE